MSSFGCSCVFLIGTDSVEDEPIAIQVNSGDVLVMRGPCRTAFHGSYLFFQVNNSLCRSSQNT